MIPIRNTAIASIFLGAMVIGAVAMPGLSQAISTPEASAREASDARIDAILDQLSVEERVGQLFVVSFVGQNATPADAISELILEYKIGGVVLMETNNNIDNDVNDTLAQVTNLTNQLQNRAYEASLQTASDRDFFLPMFVAIDHEGDGFPNTRLRNGFTPIPSTMSLGATWSPSDVEAVGTIIGRELAAVGINMLLGPVVDVLDNPRPEGSGDINIRAFGGSPFWVGKLGRAYIRGVHEGSDSRVLTVAKHFPGHGASDRLPDDEVATVNKSLDELRQSDLVPFFAIAQRGPTDQLGVTDGMMPSHIRYRGFQGDVSQLTRPISLDREGMEAFMALTPLDEWREAGLIVCDSLGVPAIKSYYDPTEQSFPARQIAKDALMAGNDVLPLVNFAPANDLGWFSGQLPTIQDTISYFQEEYRANDLFRNRADDAVRHILRSKLRLYPDLTLDSVLVSREGTLVQEERLMENVARKALTLLYPRPEDLLRRLPAPPRSDEDILIVGCFEDCLTFVRIRGDAVRNTLLDLYGPSGSDQVDPERVHLLDFMHLYQLMSGRSEVAGEDDADQAQAIIERVQAADWILLILINYMPDTQPQTGAARLFLRDPAVTVNGISTRFDLRDKKLVAIALHAPYYLDATEIGKLSAYYAVYSKIAPSLRVALRALFQDVTPSSAPPVSVEGIGYDLKTALHADPKRPMTLSLEATADDVRKVGDEVRVQIGPILDHNGNAIADGTRVRFQGTYSDLAMNLSPRLVTDTIDGFAGAVFWPTAAGRLEIQASTDGVEAEPISLLVAPAVPTAEAPVLPTQTRPAPTIRPTATIPPPTETIEVPTETAVLATETLKPTPTVAGTSSPTPSATRTPSASGVSYPPGPAIVVVVALLALAFIGFLFYWGRSTSVVPVQDQMADEPEATSTVSANLADLSPPLTGRTLGSCRVDQKLGEGGMGQVYRGYHPMLDRSVAIKILAPALIQSEEMRARFLQEARIAAGLRHPNIVQIYDFGETEGIIYMVMEFVDGTSLKIQLSQLGEAGQVMPVAHAVDIGRQIAGALAYAHENGAIHRDLKPANILLTEHRQAILVDFGLAVLRGAPRYTEPGKVWGSPTYIAPEQLADPSKVGTRSDIYSLGVLLYEMTTGRPPFRGDSVMEVLWQHANVSPRPPRELAPDLPTALEAIILKALAKRPNERYAEALHMANALDAWQS